MRKRKERGDGLGRKKRIRVCLVCVYICVCVVWCLGKILIDYPIHLCLIVFLSQKFVYITVSLSFHHNMI